MCNGVCVCLCVCVCGPCREGVGGGVGGHNRGDYIHRDSSRPQCD